MQWPVASFCLLLLLCFFWVSLAAADAAVLVPANVNRREYKFGNVVKTKLINEPFIKTVQRVGKSVSPSDAYIAIRLNILHASSIRFCNHLFLGWIWMPKKSHAHVLLAIYECETCDDIDSTACARVWVWLRKIRAFSFSVGSVSILAAAHFQGVQLKLLICVLRASGKWFNDILNAHSSIRSQL